MAKKPFLAAPVPSTRMPPGIPYIVGNEAAERFSFYGMRAILVVFMTNYLCSASGALDVMSGNEADKWYHAFLSAVYFLPLLGAILCDGFWGKYRTIFWLSIVYCFGHAALAINDTRAGLALGLGLIALGSGGIKPCVSANVGDQFGQTNQALVPRAFAWFYLSVNLGSSLSIALIPVLLGKYGPHVAFGVPGILMFVATVVFWLGRYKFVHIPPRGVSFLRQVFDREGLIAIGKLAIIFAFVAVFWSLWDQSGDEWVLQAEKMNLHFLGFHLLAGQTPVANALLILILVPAFQYVVYPLINLVFPLTALRKIGLGIVAVGLSFVVSAWIETRLAAGAHPNIAWQLPAYILLTSGEVMTSITALEFSYTQAPNVMKSFVMALYLLSISAGNAFTATVHAVIQNPDGTAKLSGAPYYLFFTGLALAAALVFSLVARRYQEKTHLQEEQPATVAA